MKTNSYWSEKVTPICLLSVDKILLLWYLQCVANEPHTEGGNMWEALLGAFPTREAALKRAECECNGLWDGTIVLVNVREDGSLLQEDVTNSWHSFEIGPEGSSRKEIY